MGWKLMIVDDDRNVCECLKSLVDWSRLGCNMPVIAYDGRQALKILQKEAADFLICDLKMPHMDGSVLMREVRRFSPDTDVIFISGYEDFRIAQEAMCYGVKRYILKPINQQTLTELEGLLKSLIFQKKSKQLYRSILSPDMKQKFRCAIREKDTEWLEDFIGRLSDCEENYAPLIIDWIGDYLEHDAFMAAEAVDIIVKNYQMRLSGLRGGEGDFLLGECRKLMERRERMEKNAESLAVSIKKYVLEHYSDNNLGVETIAARMHLSAGYISRIFTQDVGLSLQDFIIQTRMHAAKRLLLETEWTITEISERCGFSDANYFSKVFRRKCGCSPKELREKHVKYGIQENLMMDFGIVP